MTKLSFSFVDIAHHRYVRDHEPDECPICHYSIKPEEELWKLASGPMDADQFLEIVYHCPRKSCGHYFIARYLRSDIDMPTNATKMGLSPGIRQFEYIESAPATPPDPNVPKEINDVSPQFLNIYAQALAAESYGLDQVAGVAYRKALEYLLKDYCIARHKDKETTIKAANLSTCIKDFVDNVQVKSAAERATWLGNDETHYIRVWVDKDIEDLKILITLTMNWIHSSILTEKYEREMPRKSSA